MLKGIKKTLVNAIKLIIVVLFGASICRMLCSRKERTKTLINLVWNNIQDDLVKELGLPKVPELKFETLDGALACTQCAYVYNGWFDKTIAATQSDFVIRVDIDKVATCIDAYRIMARKPFSGIEKAVIQQILAHETRHVWQAHGDFYIGTKIPMFDTSFLSGYGLKREELDANEYAVRFARNDKERIVAMHFKACQENAGTISAALGFKENQRKLAKRVREVYSK